MADYKAEFIKIPIDPANGFQTHPVEPQARLPDTEITVSLCTPADAPRIAAGLYTCFPDSWWANKEPLEQRDPDQSVRERRLATRILPTFHNPHMKWVKAVHTPSGQIAGVAGWAAPGMDVYTVLRRSAVEYYGYKELMGWSDEDVEEMWKGTSIQGWDGFLGDADKIRQGMMGEEPHWYLAPILTWPEFQGKGVGSKLMKWAIEQADAQEPPTPMYLESRPTARAVYMHYGFVPQGDYNFLRRGPKVVRGLEAEADDESGVKKADVKVVEKETDAARIS